MGGTDGASNNPWIADALVYNNILENCGTGSSQAGLRMGDDDCVWKIFNNTIRSVNGPQVRLQ